MGKSETIITLLKYYFWIHIYWN